MADLCSADSDIEISLFPERGLKSRRWSQKFGEDDLVAVVEMLVVCCQICHVPYATRQKLIKNQLSAFGLGLRKFQVDARFHLVSTSSEKSFQLSGI